MATNSNTGQAPKRTVLSISIDQIDLTDTQFQVRSSLNQDKLKEYEQILQDSGSYDLSAFHSRPLVWKRPDRRYAILDGWHRIHAAKAISIKQFDVDVLEEDKTQATIQAMRSNLAHGLPLKPQERLQACLRTIEALTTPDGTQPSNETVAGLLGVAEGTIRNYKVQLVADGRLKTAEKVLGKNGKIQAAKKTSMKKPAVGPLTVARSEAEESTISKSSSPKEASNDRSAGLPSYSWKEYDKMVKAKAPAATPANTPVSWDDRNNLRRATQFLRGLNAKVWQACEDREETASVVNELVKAGTAALKANGAAKPS